MDEQQMHLDRAERFAIWLEAKREAAGVERKELYEKKIVSESFYTKFVTIGNTRKRHGDKKAAALAPRNESRVLVKALEYIARGNREIIAEGLSILGLHHDEIEEYGKFNESSERLGRIIKQLANLPPDDLHHIEEVVNRFHLASRY